MRIIHTDTDDLDNPLRGGQPVRTFEINQRLSHQNEIQVFTSTYRNSKKNTVRNGVKYTRLGVTIPRWGLSSHLSFLARLPAAIKRTPHDLVVEEFTPPFGFCGLEKHTTMPVVSIVQWFFFDDWQARYKLPFEKIMRKRALSYPQRHIIVQTHQMGEYFKELLPNAQLYKVPCGISAESFCSQVPVGDYALFLGRLDIHHKGLDDLLNAWQLLREQQVNIPLWIVGAGPDEEWLKARVIKLGLSHLVHFKGRMEGFSKQKALQNCRFLVMPSRQETFGITALEAMANTKPVIAYNINHLNELLQTPYASMIALGHVSKLAEAIADYWLYPQKCVAQGLLAYEASQAYNWDVLAKQQYHVYQQVTSHQQT